MSADRAVHRTPAPPGAAARGPAGSLATALLACVLAAPLARATAAPAPSAAPSVATRPAPSPRAELEQIALSPGGAARARATESAARRAGLDDVLWVLRHAPAELGSAERVLVRAALQRTPPAREDLRHRLEARQLLDDPRAAHKAGRTAAELESTRPLASVFRVGVLLPDRGDYASYGHSVRAAVAAGLAWGRRPGVPPIEVEFHGTGDAEPARVAAALDTASRACGSIVGELLSGPTFALATGARFLGLPLVSPTATDESIGRVGAQVFQVGPSSRERGERLARAVVARGTRRIAVLTSSAAPSGAFVAAFVAEAESLGATVVRRDTYAAGSVDFRVASRALRTFGAEALFWDGEVREAEALVRQLGADGAHVAMCGGSSLAPEQFHASTRGLLEGVMYVGDDWQLEGAQAALVDSLARGLGERPGALWVRGFLAGRSIAAAVDGGARTPYELAARLRRGRRDPLEAGFIALSGEGATLPVFVVAHGRPAPWSGGTGLRQ